MKILAMDIASNTGVCFGTACSTPNAWSVDFGKGLSDSRRFANALKFTKTCIEKYQPDYVAVECAIGGPTTSHFLVGAFSCVVGQANLMGVEVLRFRVASIRKHFLGKHLRMSDYPGLSKPHAKKEIKRAVISRCNALGWSVEDDDAADAAALWDYACATMKVEHQMKTVGGLFNNKG